MDSLLNNLISQLQVPQKVYQPAVWSKPDFNQYPVDFLYSGRLLLLLGDNFKDYKVDDGLHEFTFFSAVAYAISNKHNMILSRSQSDEFGVGIISEEEFCKKIGINVIVIGPDPSKYRLVVGLKEGEGCVNDLDEIPFVMIYRNMEDMYYPIVTLERKESNIHYRRRSSILQKLMPK